jgi:periplasmic protein TonB
MLDALRAYLAERPLVDGLGPLGRRAARQAYQGRFVTALMIAGAIHVTLTTLILLIPRADPPVVCTFLDPVAPIYRIKLPTVQDEPAAPQPPSGPKAAPTTLPSDGVPVPVPEQEAEFESIRTYEQIGIQGVEEGYGIGDDDVLGGGDGTGTGEGVPELDDIRPNPDLPTNVEKMPVLTVGPAPAYPELARLSQLEGTVIVRALVGKDGKVRETILLKKVNDILNQAAVQATMGYVFVPAMQNGRPVAVWVTIPFRFALH